MSEKAPTSNQRGAGAATVWPPVRPADTPLTDREGLILGATQAMGGISGRVAQSVELLVIESARVFDPGLELDLQADVIVADGKIEKIEPGAAQSVTNAHALRRCGVGRWVLPGFTELCAQLGEPGLEFREDLNSGLQAAARGGFTRVCCTPDTQPVLDAPALIEWLCMRAKNCSSVELLPIAASTLGLAGQSLSEMAALVEAGAIAVGSAHRTIESSSALRRVLEYASSLQLPVFHPAGEPNLTRNTEMNEGEMSMRLGLRGSPAFAESIGLHRDVQLAEAANSRLHSSHLTTAAGLQVLLSAHARQASWLANSPRGQITASVPITHLLFNETSLSEYDTAFKLEPPLRAETDRMALCRALESGALSAVISDHRPQVVSQKDCDFASSAPGGVGLSTCFSLLLALVNRGEISLSRAVAALTTGPATVLNLPPASLRVGERANLSLVDPKIQWQVTPESLGSKCHNTPFLGHTLVGRVELTLSNGATAFDSLAP